MISSCDQFAAMRRLVLRVNARRKQKISYDSDLLAEIAEPLAEREAQHDANMPRHRARKRTQSEQSSRSTAGNGDAVGRPSFN